MFAHSRSLWTSRDFPLFLPDGEQGGSATESESKSGTESEKPDTSKGDDQQLGEAGKAALQKERDAREAAEKEAKRLKKIVDDAEAAQKKREADEAAARGEFEKLAVARQDEIDRLKADLAERDRKDLQGRIGRKHNLPDALIEVLKGDSEADLEAHAKELAKHVKPPTAADTEAGDKGKSTATTRTGPADRPADAKNGEKQPNYSFLPAGAVPIP